MIKTGLRRLLVAFGLAVGVTSLLSVVIGPAMGGSLQRSISVGFMLGGSFVMLIGLAAGLRGFGRPSEQQAADAGSERVASAAVLIGIGIALVFLGVGLDPRTDIV